MCRYELNLLLEGVCGGSLRGSDVFLSSFFIVWLGVLRGVCGALGVLLSSSESERVMQGLETEREAEGEGDAGGLRAAGGKRYRKELKKKKDNKQLWTSSHSQNPQCFGDAHEIQTDTPQTIDTLLAAAMNKIWAIINVGVVSTSSLGVEQMLCV